MAAVQLSSRMSPSALAVMVGSLMSDLSHRAVLGAVVVRHEVVGQFLEVAVVATCVALIGSVEVFEVDPAVALVGDQAMAEGLTEDAAAIAMQDRPVTDLRLL